MHTCQNGGRPAVVNLFCILQIVRPRFELQLGCLFDIHWCIMHLAVKYILELDEVLRLISKLYKIVRDLCGTKTRLQDGRAHENEELGVDLAFKSQNLDVFGVLHRSDVN